MSYDYDYYDDDDSYESKSTYLREEGREIFDEIKDDFSSSLLKYLSRTLKVPESTFEIGFEDEEDNYRKIHFWIAVFDPSLYKKVIKAVPGFKDFSATTLGGYETEKISYGYGGLADQDFEESDFDVDVELVGLKVLPEYSLSAEELGEDGASVWVVAEFNYS